MAFLPFWWRFWQCINKWYKSGNKLQLVNACKYLSKFGPPITLLAGAVKDITKSTFWFYFAAQLFTTLFCLYWDFRWDWGLFTSKTHRVLRDESKYSPNFYYACMIGNTILRFWWLIAYAVITVEQSSLFLKSINIMLFLGMLLEAVRRTLWSLLRIENEFFNNFEEFRDIIIIPPINDETQVRNQMSGE